PTIREPIVGSEQVDRIERALRRLCHRCRNSLHGIKIGLYVFEHQREGPLPESWGGVKTAFHDIERLFDWMQLIHRPLSLTLVRSPLGQLVAERLPNWRSWFVSSGRTLELEPPEPDVVGEFDPMHLGLGLDALVAWRAELVDSNRQPVLGWLVNGGCFE